MLSRDSEPQATQLAQRWLSVRGPTHKLIWALTMCSHDAKDKLETFYLLFHKVCYQKTLESGY